MTSEGQGRAEEGEVQMVTSLQVTRGMVRTMRAMDRATKQSERQRIARQQAMARQAHLDASAEAAETYEAVIARTVLALAVGTG